MVFQEFGLDDDFTAWLTDSRRLRHIEEGDSLLDPILVAFTNAREPLIRYSIDAYGNTSKTQDAPLDVSLLLPAEIAATGNKVGQYKQAFTQVELHKLLAWAVDDDPSARIWMTGYCEQAHVSSIYRADVLPATLGQVKQTIEHAIWYITLIPAEDIGAVLFHEGDERLNYWSIHLFHGTENESEFHLRRMVGIVDIHALQSQNERQAFCLVPGCNLDGCLVGAQTIIRQAGHEGWGVLVGRSGMPAELIAPIVCGVLGRPSYRGRGGAQQALDVQDAMALLSELEPM